MIMSSLQIEFDRALAFIASLEIEKIPDLQRHIDRFIERLRDIQKIANKRLSKAPTENEASLLNKVKKITDMLSEIQRRENFSADSPYQDTYRSFTSVLQAQLKYNWDFNADYFEKMLNRYVNIYNEALSFEEERRELDAAGDFWS